MTDLEQQAREVLRQCVRAHNAADEDNDVTIWPDMEPPIIAAMLAFRDGQPGEGEVNNAINNVGINDK